MVSKLFLISSAGKSLKITEMITKNAPAPSSPLYLSRYGLRFFRAFIYGYASRGVYICSKNKALCMRLPKNNTSLMKLVRFSRELYDLPSIL